MVRSYESTRLTPTQRPEPRANELMDTAFITLEPTLDIYDAMDILLSRSLTGAPVVKNGLLVGIISEKDCLRLAAIDAYDNMLAGGPVSEFMTSNVLTLAPDTSLSAAAKLFVDLPFKKIPVLDEGRLIGMLRRNRVLASIQEMHRHRLAVLQATRVVDRKRLRQTTT